MDPVLRKETGNLGAADVRGGRSVNHRESH